MSEEKGQGPGSRVPALPPWLVVCLSVLSPMCMNEPWEGLRQASAPQKQGGHPWQVRELGGTPIAFVSGLPSQTLTEGACQCPSRLISREQQRPSAGHALSYVFLRW